MNVGLLLFAAALVVYAVWGVFYYAQRPRGSGGISREEVWRQNDHIVNGVVFFSIVMLLFSVFAGVGATCILHGAT